MKKFKKRYWWIMGLITSFFFPLLFPEREEGVVVFILCPFVYSTFSLLIYSIFGEKPKDMRRMQQSISESALGSNQSLGYKLKSTNQVNCPKCGSTQIHSGKRGWKVTTGFLGSSKIICTCLKCGYTFKPGGK